MTVGQTNNLGLLYPNPDDPVPNFPGINTNNMDKLDSLLGSFELQSYIPSLSPSGGTPPNLGDAGQTEGRYYKLFDMYFVHIWVKFDGSGVDPGSGDYRITLPSGVDSDYLTSFSGAVIGGGWCHDFNSASNRKALSVLFSGATSVSEGIIFMRPHSGSGSVVADDVPFTWAANDQLEVYCKYKAPSV